MTTFEALDRRFKVFPIEKILAPELEARYQYSTALNRKCLQYIQDIINVEYAVECALIGVVLSMQ